MEEKHKKGEIQIVGWKIDKINAADSKVVITLDKENIQKLIYGMIGLVKNNDTFYLGFNLSDFGVHFEHRVVGIKNEPKELKKN